jgi:hypothetical protein
MPDSDEAENVLVIDLVRSSHTVMPPRIGAEPHYRSGPGAAHGMFKVKMKVKIMYDENLKEGSLSECSVTASPRPL